MINLKNIICFSTVIIVILTTIGFIVYHYNKNLFDGVIFKSIIAPLFVTLSTFLLIGWIGNGIQIKNYEFNKRNAAIILLEEMKVDAKNNKLFIRGKFCQGGIKRCMIVSFKNSSTKIEMKYIPISLKTDTNTD